MTIQSIRMTILIGVIVTLSHHQICTVSSFTTTVVPHVRNSVIDIGRRSPSYHLDSRLWYKDDKTTNNETPSQFKIVVIDKKDKNNDDRTIVVDNNNAASTNTRAIAVAAAFGQKYQNPIPKKVYEITPIQQFFYTILDIWGYIAFGLGVSLSFGLVLNVLGYVYYIAPADTQHHYHFKLIIDTFEHIRMSNELSAMP